MNFRCGIDAAIHIFVGMLIGIALSVVAVYASCMLS